MANRKPAKEKLKKPVTMYLTEVDFEALRSAAESAGMGIGVIARDAILFYLSKVKAEDTESEDKLQNGD